MVFLDGFDVFEEYYPDLVAVDSSGRSAKRVDFIEREREEMQRLTKATEIDTNVWVSHSDSLGLRHPLTHLIAILSWALPATYH